MARYLLLKTGVNDDFIDTGYKALFYDGNGILSEKEGSVKTPIQASLPYTTYVALLTQVAESDPTATIVDNTLTGTPVLTRQSAGIYHLTLTGEFTASNTTCKIGSVNSDFNTTYKANITRLSDNVIEISTGDYWIPSPSDDVLSATSIEIKIY